MIMMIEGEKAKKNEEATVEAKMVEKMRMIKGKVAFANSEKKQDMLV